MLAVPHPFVAYLRVYEPASAFSEPLRDELLRAVTEPVPQSDAGAREQAAWLRTQIASPPRLLPEELGDGTPRPQQDVLLLRPEDVPTGDAAEVGPGPLLCPLDLRGRSAAALVGFIAEADVPLRTAALTSPENVARSRATSVISELATSAVHVLSSTWTVPLPWFVLVDVDEQVDIDAPEPCVRWRTSMAEARRRVARAHAIARDAIGEDGPTRILRETGRWLERFHPHSAVELDYGGLVQLMSDSDIEADTSAADVHAIVDAMENGDNEEVGVRYQALREFWGAFAERERLN